MTRKSRYIRQEELTSPAHYTKTFLDAGMKVVTGGVNATDYKVIDQNGIFGEEGSVFLSLNLVLKHGALYLHPDEADKARIAFETVDAWNREETPDD